MDTTVRKAAKKAAGFGDGLDESSINYGEEKKLEDLEQKVFELEAAKRRLEADLEDARDTLEDSDKRRRNGELASEFVGRRLDIFDRVLERFGLTKSAFSAVGEFVMSRIGANAAREDANEDETRRIAAARDVILEMRLAKQDTEAAQASMALVNALVEKI